LMAARSLALRLGRLLQQLRLLLLDLFQMVAHLALRLRLLNLGG
jgi:hypothetical protein